jgi:CheY-like chemotaxis protein
LIFREYPMRTHPMVLIVDDNADTSEMYAIGLSYAGFDIVQAQSAAEALEQATIVEPDVIVTDVGLAGSMDGFGLARRFRLNERMSRVGIIVVTGRIDPSSREEATRAGCDLFLAKPCLPDRLAVEVTRVIAAREQRTAQATAG